ncbi:MAG: ankyrin repeat domain-containing protein [Verrucomicrobiota bacterium]
MNFLKRLFGTTAKSPASASEKRTQPTTPNRGLPSQASSPAQPTLPSKPPSSQRLTESTLGKGELDGKLIQAIKDRKVDDVRSLLAAGANPNTNAKYTHHGKWNGGMAAAIHFATISSYAYGNGYDKEEEPLLQIIDLLLDAGADVNAPGADAYSSGDGPFTAVMNAVQLNRPKVVERLLERGADANVRRPDGSTAFRLCMNEKHDSDSKRHWDVVRALAKYSQDGKAWANSPEGRKWMKDTTEDSTAPLGVSPMSAWSVFQSAMGKSSQRQDEIIKWVESGGNVNWTCSEGMTLLHYAAMQDDVKMVRFLLERGANVNALAKFQMTPLLRACKSISTSVIPILLEHGADPNAKTESGYTALQFIRQSGLEEAKKMADLILSHGVKTTPGKDSTCSECGAPETVRMRERGVQVTFNGAFAEFACLSCKKQLQAPLESITKDRGVQVLCSCRAITFIPPSVWCKTCKQGLSTGWQKSLSLIRG